MFLVFKQYYMHFYTFFHPHVFPKNTNNITQTPLPNDPLVSLAFSKLKNRLILGGQRN